MQRIWKRVVNNDMLMPVFKDDDLYNSSYFFFVVQLKLLSLTRI
jgi:hypothetical protein